MYHLEGIHVPVESLASYVARVHVPVVVTTPRDAEIDRESPPDPPTPSEPVHPVHVVNQDIIRHLSQ